MKYKFKLTNTTADYVPNGYLGHLKMFVGDEQAVQQGGWTNLNGNLKNVRKQNNGSSSGKQRCVFTLSEFS